MTIQTTRHDDNRSDRPNLITEAIAVAQTLSTLTQRLNDAFAVEVTLNRELSRKKKALEQAESEYVTEAVIQAQKAKTGPLAGIALTSPAFKDAREVVIAHARKNGLKTLAGYLQTLEIQTDDALIARQQIENSWHAARTAANIYEAILQSMRK